jgi:hypothetical protein
MLPAFYINLAFYRIPRCSIEYLSFLGKVYNEIDPNMILYEFPRLFINYLVLSRSVYKMPKSVPGKV